MRAPFQIRSAQVTGQGACVHLTTAQDRKASENFKRGYVPAKNMLNGVAAQGLIIVERVANPYTSHDDEGMNTVPK